MLERGARTAVLTEAGELLARHAASVLAAIESAESDLLAYHQRARGHVRVSVIPSLALRVAGDLAQMQGTWPEIDVVVHQTSSQHATRDVVDRVSDVAVIDDWGESDQPDTAGVVRRQCFSEPVVLAVPYGHELADAPQPLSRAVLAREIPRLTWLSAPDGQFSRVAGDRLLRELGVDPQRRWEFEGLDTLAALVAQGNGVALLPLTVARAVDGSRVVPLRLRGGLRRAVHTVTRTSHAGAPAVAACLRAVTQGLRELARASKAVRAGRRADA